MRVIISGMRSTPLSLNMGHIAAFILISAATRNKQNIIYTDVQTIVFIFVIIMFLLLYSLTLRLLFNLGNHQVILKLNSLFNL